MLGVQQRRQTAASGTNGTKMPTKKRVASSTGKRKGNPGPRNGSKGTPGKAADDIASDPFEEPSPGNEEPEQLMSTEDKERMAIVTQIQDLRLTRHFTLTEIIKRGQEAGSGPEEEFEIERLLHGYVSMCHNAAMEFMKTNQSRAAGRMLRQCQDFMERGVPQLVAQIVLTKGIMHTVFNNLAQHANMVADMNCSIEYLEKALEAAERPEADQDLLPLAETYLNLANGYSFMNKYEQALVYSEKALKFSEIRCNKLREEIQEERASQAIDGPNPKIESLDFQLNDFIAIRVMSHLCVGEQHEKLCNYNRAIKQYSEGKQVAETNFGTRHPLYTKCINSMGGARLKSKYQTKEVFRNPHPTATQTQGKPPVTKTKKTKKVKSRSPPKENPPKASRHHAAQNNSHEQNPIKSKLMARRLQGSSQTGSRRDIKKVMQTSMDNVRQSHQNMRQYQDNLLLANCDTWTAVHCRHVRPRQRESLMVSMEKQRQRSRMRPTSARSERKMSKSPLRNIKSRRRPKHDETQDDLNMRASIRSSKSNKSMRNSLPPISEPAPGVETPAKTEPVETQSAAALNKSDLDVVDTRSQRSLGNQSASIMLQQTERIHQQQMQHMRTMQEDQFKMLQLVIESSQQKNQTQNMPQQPAYMMYPHMYAGAGYGYPPQFYGQQAWQYPQQMMMYGNGYPQWGQGAPDDTDASCTETDLSDAEQIKEGRRPAQSELSKAEHYEQAYTQQQQQMQAMERKMSEMQLQYQQQIEEMRASHEALKNKARSSRGNSAASEKKVRSYKDFREDDSDVNNRDDEVALFRTNFDNKTISHRNSQLNTKTHVLPRDQSVQVMDSLTRDKSILKAQSSIKSVKDTYRTHGSPPKDQSGISVIQSVAHSIDLDQQPEKSFHSRRQSARSTRSMKSEKSFRVPPEQMRISKQDAALRIQKNFKAYQARQDFQMLVRRGSEKRFLFKATVRGQQSQIIQCSVNVTPQGRPCSLIFVLSEARKPQQSQREEIDLQDFNIRDTNDLKDKVLRVIREALASDHIMQAIREAFFTDLAQEILEAEFYSSDDQFGSGSELGMGRNSRNDGKQIISTGQESALPQIPEEQVQPQRPSSRPGQRPTGSNKDRQGSMPTDQRSLIDAEIERIRKRCDIQYRVNVESVEVKGHKLPFDDYEHEDQVDDEMDRDLKLDSEDEHREINIQRIGIRRRFNVEGAARGMEVVEDEEGQPVVFDDDLAEESQHDYEIVLGQRNMGKNLVRKLNMRQIVLIQSLVRGFLARCENKMRRHILFCRVLRRDEDLVRITLSKQRRNNYTLAAQLALKKHISQKKHLSCLPFEEADASDRVEGSLVFKMEGETITELDLAGGDEPRNPFLDTNETHLFITYYEQKKQLGEHLIHEWRLRDQYPTQLFEVNERDGDSIKNYFKVVVRHQNLRHYLKVTKLPFDMFYMAYYFNELLFLAFSGENVFSYIYMKQMLSKREFLKRMQQLEIRFFGNTKESMDQSISSAKSSSISNVRSRSKGSNRSNNQSNSIDYSTIAKPQSRESRRFRSEGKSEVESFTVHRNGNDYIVQVYDETEQQGRYSIHVKRQGQESDQDYIQVSQVKLEVNELIRYLRANLKIQVKDIDGTIDYLSLAHDYQVFSRSKRSAIDSQTLLSSRSQALEQVTVSLHESRTKQPERRRRPKNEDHLNRQSTEGLHPPNMRIEPQLEQTLEEFTIQRNNRNYLVRVEERKNFEGQPLQINVIAEDDQSDTKYMIFKNTKQMSDAALRDYFQRHLLVYSKWDAEREYEMIDYIALAKIPEEYTRSQTMSLTPSSSGNISKSKLIKSRAGKLRGAQDQHSVSMGDQSNRQSQTLNNTGNIMLDGDESINQSVSRSEQGWEELTRQFVPHGQQRLIVHLYSKRNRNLASRSNAPLPSSPDDSKFYKIVVVGSMTSETLGELTLSVQACQALLKLDSEKDLQVNHSAYLSLQDIMRGSAQILDRTQTDLLRSSCSYLRNKAAWNTILKNVSYDEHSQEIKFDVWSICQTVQNINMSPSNGKSPSKIKTVAISSKLQRNSTVNSAACESVVTCVDDEIPSQLDGREDIVLSEPSVAEDLPQQPKFKIVRKTNMPEERKRQSSVEHSSQAGSDFPEEQDGQKTRCQGIVRTATGQFLNVLMTQTGQNFNLTISDKQNRSVKICDGFELPMSFVDNIDDEDGFDRTQAIFNAVKEQLQTCQEVTNINGTLNARVFL